MLLRRICPCHVWLNAVVRGTGPQCASHTNSHCRQATEANSMRLYHVLRRVCMTSSGATLHKGDCMVHMHLRSHPPAHLAQCDSHEAQLDLTRHLQSGNTQCTEEARTVLRNARVTQHCKYRAATTMHNDRPGKLLPDPYLQPNITELWRHVSHLPHPARRCRCD